MSRVVFLPMKPSELERMAEYLSLTGDLRAGRLYATVMDTQSKFGELRQVAYEASEECNRLDGEVTNLRSELASAYRDLTDILAMTSASRCHSCSRLNRRDYIRCVHCATERQ